MRGYVDKCMCVEIERQNFKIRYWDLGHWMSVARKPLSTTSPWNGVYNLEITDLVFVFARNLRLNTILRLRDSQLEVQW